MPDSTAPLGCGHGRNEEQYDPRGCTYCQRCEDLINLRDGSMCSKGDRLGAALRELARVRAERDKAELCMRESERCYEADIGKLKDMCEETQTDLEATQDLVFEMFRQGCYLLDTAPPRYDHECTSVYEEAQTYLTSIGRVKPEECVRP